MTTMEIVSTALNGTILIVNTIAAYAAVKAISTKQKDDGDNEE